MTTHDPCGRLATWNLHHGAPPGRMVAPARPGGVLRGLGLDLLAVQEVDRRVIRSRFVDQVGLLARTTGLHAVFVRTRSLHPGGHYGHALLSASPPRAVQIVRLPRCGVEPRAGIVAAVTVGGVDLSVAAVHLHNAREVALVQLDVLLDQLLRRPGPHLLLGDLNLTPDEAGKLLADAGFGPVPPPAFPSRAPTRSIDWIVGRGLSVEDVVVLDDRSSDHRPLVATLRVTSSNLGSFEGP